MAMTAGLAICQHHRRPFRILRYPSRSRKHRVPARATVQLVQKILPPPCAQAPGKALVPGLLSTLFRTALSTANTGARGRCL